MGVAISIHAPRIRLPQTLLYIVFPWSDRFSYGFSADGQHIILYIIGPTAGVGTLEISGGIYNTAGFRQKDSWQRDTNLITSKTQLLSVGCGYARL